MYKISEQQILNPKVLSVPILAITMKIPKMAKVVYRQMPAPRDLPPKIPALRAKIRMQKPQIGGNFLCKSSGVLASTGWCGGDGYGKN